MHRSCGLHLSRIESVASGKLSDKKQNQKPIHIA
jgi:hypothetical protein